jgi:hypothetical protein
MTAFAISDGNQLHIILTPGHRGEQTAAGQHFIVWVWRKHDQARPGRYQLFEGNGAHAA